MERRLWLSVQYNRGAYSTGSSIAGTNDPTLYQTERYGLSDGVTPLTYQFTVATGTYTVNLKFAEIYYSQAGQRVMNIAINGSTVLSNFDIVAAAGGPNTAVDRSFTVVSGGTITIQLVPVVSNLKVSAIEILPQGNTQLTEDPCQRTTFYYDTNPFDGSFSQYAVSRPTAAQWGAANCPAPYQFTELYSYNQGGAVTRKRLTVGNLPGFPASLETSQTYDNEGKPLTVKYPDTQMLNTNLTLQTLTGTTYTYGYDGRGRPVSLVDNQPSPITWVSNVQYGVAGELRQIRTGRAARW